MKLRTGFVSNSSSSSFIISDSLVYNNVYNTYDELDAEDILNAVKYEIRKYRDNKIKYAKRYLKHYKDEPTEGDISDYRKGIMARYSDKNIDNLIDKYVSELLFRINKINSLLPISSSKEPKQEIQEIRKEVSANAY